MSVLEISRVDRENQTYDLPTLFPKLGGSFTVASVALLPPRTGPSAATVWLSVTVASNTAPVLFAGPDADPTGAVVATGNADVWIKTTVGSQTDAVKAGTVRVAGGAGLVATPVDRSVPAGGTTGQVLAKASNAAYDTTWVAQTGGGGGGAVSSVNTKTGAVVLSASDVGADAAGAATTAQAFSIQRANHTGTQSADTLTDGTTNKAFLATERTKLTGVATGATANATDAQLRDRSTHTGTQAATTITGLATVATSGAYADLTGKNVVVHGTDPNVARPATSDPVIWFGTVNPVNANDTLDVYVPIADAGSSSPSTTLGQVPPRTFAVLGDSLSGNIGAAGTITSPVTNAVHIVSTIGYWTWAAMRLSGRAVLSYNHGVGGNTTTQILARVGDVTAHNPKPGYCVVQGYSNDPPASIPTATTISNLIAICEGLRLAGITPVLCAAVPKNLTPIPPGQINRALYEYARTTPGVIFCDWYPYIADPTTGQYATGMSDDGIHPNAGGASRMGIALAKVLDPLLAATPPLYGSNVDNLNKLSNGMFVGGTTLATGWTTRMGANTTGSKVARTDGLQGEWQQLTVASPGTTGAGDIYASWTATVGDILQASIEFEIDPGVTGLTTFDMRIADSSGANEQMIVNSKDDASNLGTGTITLPARGVLRSPPFQTQAASGFFLAKFGCTTGTIRWGHASLVKVG